jgi:hypothetical protein
MPPAHSGRAGGDARRRFPGLAAYGRRTGRVDIEARPGDAMSRQPIPSSSLALPLIASPELRCEWSQFPSCRRAERVPRGGRVSGACDDNAIEGRQHGGQHTDRAKERRRPRAPDRIGISPRCLQKGVDSRRQAGRRHQSELDSKCSPNVGVEQVPPLNSGVAHVDDPGGDKNAERGPRNCLISPARDSRQLTLTSEKRDQGGNSDLATDPDAGRQDVQPENQRRPCDVQHGPSP